MANFRFNVFIDTTFSSCRILIRAEEKKENEVVNQQMNSNISADLHTQRNKERQKIGMKTIAETFAMHLWDFTEG